MVKVPEYWAEAKAFLRRSDPIMAAVIDQHEEPPLSSKCDVFETMIHAIVGQQISAKAADAVWRRLLALIGTVAPAAVLAHEPDALKAVGLSGRKVEYIRGLALDGAWICDESWEDHTDKEVARRLVALRGVGPWTAEMVLIFSLLRPDVFPLGDIGVIRAVERLYAEGERLPVERVAEIGAGWSPYRTVATWYLWRFLDAEPVEY